MLQHVCEWRMTRDWGKLSLYDAAGNLSLSAGAEVRCKEHWRWVHKSHLCFWISITYIFIKSFCQTSPRFWLPGLWILQGTQGIQGWWPLTVLLIEQSHVTMRLGFFLPTVNFDQLSNLKTSLVEVVPYPLVFRIIEETGQSIQVIIDFFIIFFKERKML